MVLFAGPVFPQWYWGPIFFALLYGPPLLAVAFATDWLMRRRRRLTRPQRAGLAAAVLAGGTLAVIGGRALIADVHFDRDARAAAQSLDFTPYRPSPLPGRFSTEMVTAQARFGGPVVISEYGAGPGAYALAYQQRPAEVSLRDGRCSLRRLLGVSTNFFDGPCRELRTPRGRAVFVGATDKTVPGGEAFALLGGTLVHLSHVRVADRDVLAYYDSLQPVAKDDLEFKRG